MVIIRYILDYLFPKPTCFLCRIEIDKKSGEYSTIRYAYSGGEDEKFICLSCADPIDDSSIDSQ